MRRAGQLLGAVAAISCVVPASASALETRELSIGDAVARECAGRPLSPATAGIARERWTAPAEGYLTLRLGGNPYAPDWDLAAFEPDGDAAASTASGSLERANLWVREGETIRIQACRLAGGDARVPLTIDLYEMVLPESTPERISLESVAIDGGEDVARLESLGFDVTHDVGNGKAEVVLYSDAERALLASQGFTSEVEIADVAARDAVDRAREERAARQPRTPGVDELPSERTTYRELAEYSSEMKGLAAQFPGHVRSITIGTSLEGRPIEGVEITADVNNEDGRPVYLQAGLHHAREWPSGELPMEFAIDLARTYGTDPRVTQMLQRVRVVILPVMNPDGFAASRSFGTSPLDDDQNLTLAQIVAGSDAYRRKNCRGITPADQAIPCATRTTGVDLNRNYGAYWGGPGSSNDPAGPDAQIYRGTAPYSEPEAKAFLEFSESVHPMVVISNHTVTDGRWLRQPGFDADFMEQTHVPLYDSTCPKSANGKMGAISPDEAAMRNLGDAMALANEPDWHSELGYETLCDITGATEDWNYFAQGAYGYTPEARGDNFHANYAAMVVSNYIGTPGDAYDGMRGSYIIGGEEAARTANHGLISGDAPAGATLRIRKPFSIPTCEDDACNNGDGDRVDYEIDTHMTVPAPGKYEWHVNPSSRPDLDPGPGRVPPAETWSMTCKRDGQPASDPQQVLVDRGESVSVDWTSLCGRDGGSSGGGGGGGSGNTGAPPTCKGQAATIIGSKVADEIAGTPDDDVIVAKGGNDRISTRGGSDVVCGLGGADTVAGGGGGDTIFGNGGKDKLKGQKGKDQLAGGSGYDVISGGKGSDRCDEGGRDKLRSC